MPLNPSVNHTHASIQEGVENSREELRNILNSRQELRNILDSRQELRNILNFEWREEELRNILNIEWLFKGGVEKHFEHRVNCHKIITDLPSTCSQAKYPLKIHINRACSCSHLRSSVVRALHQSALQKRIGSILDGGPIVYFSQFKFRHV